jgi:hypothetical protein
VGQNILAADLVVQGIEAIAGFCLRRRPGCRSIIPCACPLRSPSRGGRKTETAAPSWEDPGLRPPIFLCPFSKGPGTDDHDRLESVITIAWNAQNSMHGRPIRNCVVTALLEASDHAAKRIPQRGVRNGIDVGPGGAAAVHHRSGIDRCGTFVSRATSSSGSPRGPIVCEEKIANCDLFIRRQMVTRDGIAYRRLLVRSRCCNATGK